MQIWRRRRHLRDDCLWRVRQLDWSCPASAVLTPTRWFDYASSDWQVGVGYLPSGPTNRAAYLDRQIRNDTTLYSARRRCWHPSSFCWNFEGCLVSKTHSRMKRDSSGATVFEGLKQFHRRFRWGQNLHRRRRLLCTGRMKPRWPTTCVHDLDKWPVDLQMTTPSRGRLLRQLSHIFHRATNTHRAVPRNNSSLC